MAIIGTFKKVGNGYEGEFAMLALQVKGVRIVAETNRSNEDAPTHRIFVGRLDQSLREEGRISVAQARRPEFHGSGLCQPRQGQGERRLQRDLVPQPRPPQQRLTRSLDKIPSGSPGGVFSTRRECSIGPPAPHTHSS